MSVVAPGAKVRRPGKPRLVQVPVMLEPWRVAELERAGKPGALLRELGHRLVDKLRLERIKASGG